MAFLRSQSDIANVEWGKSYLWDVRFDDPTIPAPFNSWFPAQEVEENKANLEAFSFESAFNSFKVPLRSAPKAVSLTFLDDANHSLFNWLDKWINGTILNNERYVSSLEESVKTLQVAKLNNQREIISTSSYLVFPEDNLTFRGSSSSESLIYSVSFYIAGTIRSSSSQGSSSSRGRTTQSASNQTVAQPNQASSVFDTIGSFFS